MDKIYLSLTIFDELAKTKRMIQPFCLQEKSLKGFAKIFTNAMNTLIEFFKYEEVPSEEQASKSLIFFSLYLKYYKDETKKNSVSEMFDAVIVYVLKILEHKFNEGKNVNVQEKQSDK